MEKSKLLANAFINSQFNYAPPIWMFANKYSTDKILKIHKKTLSNKQLMTSMMNHRKELLVKPEPRPWARTLENLDPEKPGPRKICTLKNLTMRNMDSEKSGL